MSDSNSRLSIVQQFLHQAGAGDPAAVDALLRHSSERLTALTRRMLGDFQRVRRWAETDDVLQNASVRLVKALRQVKPETPRDFLALAAVQIRRELLDLARHYYGPEGIGANHDSAAVENAQRVVRDDSGSLAQWSELHRMIDGLPDDEREVVGLLFYQGLSQTEAADVLNVSQRTVQRRWHVALCKLHRVWQGG